MSKEYTITLRDDRDFYDDPDRAFTILSMTNTVAFKIRQTLSLAETDKILADEDSTVNIKGRPQF